MASEANTLSALEAAKGNSHSLALDVHDQWAVMEKTGQWRFTPPTHTVAAFMEALLAHEAEGGVAARGARYAENRDVLVAGMRALGFETLLDDRWLSPIIVTFFCPAEPNFTFDGFYNAMKSKGFIIYPGKLTVVDFDHPLREMRPVSIIGGHRHRFGIANRHIGNRIIKALDHLAGTDREFKRVALARRIEDRSICQRSCIVDPGCFTT